MNLGVIRSTFFPCVRYHMCYLLFEGQEVNLHFELNCSQINKCSKIIFSVFFLFEKVIVKLLGCFDLPCNGSTKSDE